MSGVSQTAAFASALLAALLATPVAIRAAAQFDFYDRPTGWKTHSSPTPYLGGFAVVVALLVGAAAGGAFVPDVWPVALLAVAMWVVGTIDDRRGVNWALRVAAESAAGLSLWTAGLGWSVFPSDVANLALTVVWVLAVVNAINLLDLMDGVASSVAAASAVGIGLLAVAQDDPRVAVIAFALAGACLGFLPYNVRRPARIFLGDGGSMPIGLVVAAVTMALSGTSGDGWSVFLCGGVLFGIPLLDMVFRTLSRLRRRASLLVGGHDSLATYLQDSLGSARAVAGALGTLQALLCATALATYSLGLGFLVTVWTSWFLLGTAVVTFLEVRVWRPPDAMVGVTGDARGARDSLPPVLPGEALLIAFFVVCCGLSPFFYGFYDLSIWGPIALFLLAAVLGLLIARPATPRVGALVALAGLAALWLWALLSTQWAESAEQAMQDANRWMLYAAAFALLILLLRDDRVSRVLVSAAASVTLGLGLYVAARMALGSADEMFAYARLHEPLGYINGQAGYLLMGAWPLAAIAERWERRWLSPLAVAGCVILLGVVVLSQTRAIVPAATLSAALMLIFVPGRPARICVLGSLAVGLAVCIGPLLDVYAETEGSRPSDALLRNAFAWLAAGAAVAGAGWALGCWAWARVRRRRSDGRLPGWTHGGSVRAATALGVAAIAVGGALAFGAADWLEREYRGFVELRSANESDSRFSVGGGNRYDYWRVGLNQFADAPAHGVGAGNYDRTYFLERRTDEDIRQAHSLELQVLGELGVVGALALALFLVPVLSGFFRRARAARGSVRDRTLVVAAGGTFLVWLLHTSVDWLHLIPGVTGLALASAAVLVGPWRAEAASAPGMAQRATVLAAGVVIVCAAALMGRFALAEKYRADAREQLTVAPRQAIETADESLALDDEALSSYYVKAAAYARLDDYGRARAALLEAARREPHDFVTWGLLGDLAVRREDWARARQAYAEAAHLNPRDRRLAALATDPRAAQDSQ